MGSAEVYLSSGRHMTAAQGTATSQKEIRNDRSLLEEAVGLARTIAAEQSEIHRLVALGAAGSENTIRMANALAAGSAPVRNNPNLGGAPLPLLGPTGGYMASGYASEGVNLIAGSGDLPRKRRKNRK